MTAVATFFAGVFVGAVLLIIMIVIAADEDEAGK